MRKLRTFLALLLCAALLLSLLGCGKQKVAETTPTEPPATEAPTEAPTEPPVADLYSQAAQSLRDAKDLEFELTTEKTITTEADDFLLVSEQELIFTGLGTEAFTASLHEELEIGDYHDEFTEFYEDGHLYVNIANAGRFQGDMTEEDFLGRFAPAVLLDETLYTQVTAEETTAGMTLTFADPIAPESWALPEGAEFLSASGTAKISENGTLTRTTYSLQYAQGGTTVSLEVAAKAELYDDEPLAAPPEPGVYTMLQDITVPRIYDTAVLFLYGAETVSATSLNTVLSQAAGFSLTEQTEFHYTGTNQDHMADLTYTATSVDPDNGTEIYTHTEHFQDGAYTITAADAEPETSTDITPADMLYYLQGNFNNNVPALTYIHAVSAEELNGLLYLELELNEEWGQEQANAISYLLFEDEEYINGYASAYETTNSNYYMVVDPVTGFPLAAGTSFGGYHTIDGQDCILGLEITQTYRLADSGTYEKITGEPLVSEVAEDPATPLFYRVTGADGQQMYLMGTIHVGDNRTADLPAEIYDALYGSDAMALELNVEAFVEQAMADPELALQLATAYLNPDNGRTADLLDADVHAKAVKLLKAAGSYNTSLEYMIPYAWNSTIDGFYLSLSDMQTEKGMEMRLLKLAEENQIEVLEVESGMFQMELLTGLSTPLQVLMLEASVESTAEEYCNEIEALYEMWCDGDEASIREYLRNETADMTPEERTLYQEYLDKVIIQRNEAMLEAAVSYLESGETVFYAVGLAHLLQENGLVDTLQAAGYTVEQVLYS